MIMEFMEAILKRRNYRGHFIDRHISQKDLDFIIEAARWATSPFNIQPWQLLIITNQESKDRLANLVAHSMASQMGDAEFLHDVSQWMSLSREEWSQRGAGVMIDDHVDIPPFIRDKTKLRPLLKNAKNMSFAGKLGLGKIGAAKFVEFIRRAPLIMIILMDKQKRSPGESGVIWKFLGMGAFMEHILLAAASVNIGTHIINTALENKEDRAKVREIFSIPDRYEPICMIRAGYIQKSGERAVRLKSDQFTHYELFDDSEGKQR
jgi:nitroreductase